jgi:peptide/nickel transport system permease protein
MMQYLKNKKIWISLLFLVGLFIVSLFFNGHGKIVSPIAKDGSLIGGAPYSPKQKPPLGTDTIGYPMVYLLLKGAKFTIGIAVIAALIRLVFGAVLGVGLTLCPKWVQSGLTRLLSPVNYFPLSLLGYILLAGVVFSTPINASMGDALHRGYIELLSISFIGLPTLLIYFKDITNQLLNEEHIVASRVLGAGPFAILRRHVWVGIKGRVMIQFVEQIIQVLILLVHLGIFGMLLGGTILIPDPLDSSAPPLVTSRMSEWSGMVGLGYGNLLLFPWLCIEPLIGFTLVIFSFNLLRMGLNEAQNRFTLTEKKPSRNKLAPSPVKTEIYPDDFLLVPRPIKEVG